MLHWFYKLMPRQGTFFPLFERHAAVTVTASRTLREMLNGGEQAGLRFKDIVALEHEADDIARDVLLTLRTSFITPFDRTDIQSLITEMDDSVDQIKQTAKAIILFEVASFEPDMVAMADKIIEGAERVQRAVGMLGDLSANASELNEICLQITRIEEEADDIHERGLGRLYQKAKAGDAMEFIRGNEIYNHLEKAVDRLDDVADEIQGIVIEHV